MKKMDIALKPMGKIFSARTARSEFSEKSVQTRIFGLENMASPSLFFLLVRLY